MVSAMPRSRRSQGRAWNRPVHRHGEPPPRRLGAWLAWDSQQRPTQVSTPEHTATYQYDLLGRRVQRQITKPGFPPETTHYVYDGLQAVGEIRSQQSSTSLMTGLNLDEMLARVTTLNAPNTTQARTYLTDALGSVMAQTQDTQSTLAGYNYSPYGQTQSTGNTEGDSVQYTGRENDNNGLYYYRARYYDPVLKRFLSEDPIGLAGGSLSFYAYVEGNPISYTDPTGLICQYSQSAGTFVCTNPAGQAYASCTGYAGNGLGLNNPAAQNQQNVGPIPQGRYTVGGTTNRRGAGTRPLTPDPANNMFGRAGFLLHGDNAARNFSASQGCIIIPPQCRGAVPPGETLIVVP